MTTGGDQALINQARQELASVGDAGSREHTSSVLVLDTVDAALLTADADLCPHDDLCGV